MIHLERLRKVDADYLWAEQLMEQSFPRDERRERGEERLLVETQQLMHFELLLAENEKIGVLVWWNLGTFCYIEHFAIFPLCRSKGYGKQVLNLFLAASASPVILEVEHPIDDITQRRIAFYQQSGFDLYADFEYLQPPYREGGNAVPLLLMGSKWNECTDFLQTVRSKLYEVVYQMNSK